MSKAIVPGQRYLCEPEPELGLGRVTAVDARTLCLEFPAQGVTRRYARGAAPLRRVQHVAGDRIRDDAGEQWIVEAVQEHSGLYTYAVVDTDGKQRASLPESALAAMPELNRPLARLLGKHCEASAWFALRLRALDAANYIDRSPFLGLLGSRTALLPHQLYIAHEVARRTAPRVLLCDEVGLGKTIEACMILQQQLFSGLASRVLILVPDSLLHQWLVELLRRFNLRFTILDEERCTALAQDGSGKPFESAQLVLCSLDFLGTAPRWQAEAREAPWDLVIVDEAHHLFESASGALAGQDLVKDLANRVAGLLLLSATPNAGGWHMLFQLLQLIDPHRFFDADAFHRAQAGYEALADNIDRLLDPDADGNMELGRLAAHYAHDSALRQLFETLAAATTTATREALRQAIVRALLDRHGTGRVMFRNSRRHVGGFPRRELHATHLPLPLCYARENPGPWPETHFGEDSAWLREDPRVTHIETLLASQRGRKFLLICHERRSAEVLESWLRLQRGVRCAVFHEGLSLLERDRAAAWFAEPEGGAQLLVCSEIGSEGRNFQFVQDLILFDLPPDPDLLEQRIGRLDRIGQADTIRIHIPCLEYSPQAVLLRLYDEVLGLFTAPNPVASQLCYELAVELEAAMAAAADPMPLAALLARAATLHRELRRTAAAGRDRLLELNSCPPAQAQALLEQMQAPDAAGVPDLAQFLDVLFAAYGLDAEVSENGIWNLRPSDHMLLEHFPQLPDEGLRFTLQRKLALGREDLAFMTWLHPLVLQGIDLVVQGESGKAAFLLLRDRRLPTGTLLLEAHYRPMLDLPRRHQAWRWLDSMSLRVVIDENRREVGKSLPPDWLQQRGSDGEREQLRHLVQARRGMIEQLHRWCERVATGRLQAQLATACKHMHADLQEETNRLRALQRVNPLVPDAEIQALEEQRHALDAGYARAGLHTLALRLILVV